jgi:hypothetical protein
MKNLTVVRFTNEEIIEMSKKIEWNERELAFIKPDENYFDFCTNKRHIKNTIESYKAFDDECELWRYLAMGIILEDRVEFNAD